MSRNSTTLTLKLTQNSHRKNTTEATVSPHPSHAAFTHTKKKITIMLTLGGGGGRGGGERGRGGGSTKVFVCNPRVKAEKGREGRREGGLL